jgi:hypothetical protein
MVTRSYENIGVFALCDIQRFHWSGSRIGYQETCCVTADENNFVQERAKPLGRSSQQFTIRIQHE